MSPPVGQEPEHHEHHTKQPDTKSTKRHVLDALIDFVGGVAGKFFINSSMKDYICSNLVIHYMKKKVFFQGD